MNDNFVVVIIIVITINIVIIISIIIITDFKISFPRKLVYESSLCISLLNKIIEWQIPKTFSIFFISLTHVIVSD